MTVTVTINGKIEASQKEELSQFLRDNLPNTRSSKGCRFVEVFFDVDNTELVLYEKWISAEDHQQYVASLVESGVYDQLLAFFKGEPDVKYLESTSL